MTIRFATASKTMSSTSTSTCATPDYPRDVNSVSVASEGKRCGSPAGSLGSLGPTIPEILEDTATDSASVEERIVTKEAGGCRGAVRAGKHRAEGIFTESLTEGITTTEKCSEQLKWVGGWLAE